MRHDITVRQGATFKEKFQVFPTPDLSLVQIRAMTPRATILGTAISFGCSWLPEIEGETSVTGIWTLSRATTAVLELLKSYKHNLDISDATDTHPVAEGSVTVTEGQPPL